MDFPQTTIEEIADSERQMILTAEQRYGAYYRHACDCSVFLSRCIEGINHDRMMFARLFSHLKKHQLLALLSTVRLHKVQAMMDLRQVLEAGAGAAFAIANPQQEHFVTEDARGVLDPAQSLTSKRYKWMAENYAKKSDLIKTRKSQINLSTAHANIISGDSVFRVEEGGERASAPFFDFEDDYFVKADLWLIASVALELMDLFFGVDRNIGSLTFCAEFQQEVARLAVDNDRLLNEMKNTDRFKNAAAKFGLEEEAE